MGDQGVSPWQPPGGGNRHRPPPRSARPSRDRAAVWIRRNPRKAVIAGAVGVFLSLAAIGAVLPAPMTTQTASGSTMTASPSALPAISALPPVPVSTTPISAPIQTSAAPTMPVPTTPPSVPAPPPASPAEHLPGFGATQADWNAYHTMDTHGNTPVNCCYNPDRTLGLGDDGLPFDTYYAVNYIDDWVSFYDMRLPFVPISVANTRVLAELPSDARVLWTRTHDTCQQSEFISPTLARLHVGSGQVLVSFSSDESNGGEAFYDPKRVDTAIFMLGSSSDPNDEPGC